MRVILKKGKKKENWLYTSVRVKTQFGICPES